MHDRMLSKPNIKVQAHVPFVNMCDASMQIEEKEPSEEFTENGPVPSKPGCDNAPPCRSPQEEASSQVLLTDVLLSEQQQLPLKCDTDKTGSSDDVVEAEQQANTHEQGLVLVSPEAYEYQFELRSCHQIKTSSGGKLYQCDICSVIYRHSFSLKRHFVRTHINYQYLSQNDIVNCNVNMALHGKCKTSTDGQELDTNSTYLASPEKSAGTGSQPSDLFCCHNCSAFFASVSDLKTHCAKHRSRDTLFSCSQCPLTFAHMPNLVRHASDHSGSKPHLCKYCGKGFPTSTNQKRHERIHEGVKLYTCSLCSAVFNLSDDLKKHIRCSHQGRYHPCYQCEQVFDTGLKLEQHLKLHVNKHMNLGKPARSRVSNEIETKDDNMMVRYICSMCNKAFSHYANLCKHRRLRHDTNHRSHISLASTDILNPTYVINIAENVCDNVTYFLDGKLDQISNLAHNKADHETTTIACSVPSLASVTWEKYNFPDGFLPASTACVGSDEVVPPVNNDQGSAKAEPEVAVVDLPVAVSPEITLAARQSVMVTPDGNQLAVCTHKIPAVKSGLASSEIHQCQICKVLFRNSLLYCQHLQSKHAVDKPGARKGKTLSEQPWGTSQCKSNFMSQGTEKVVSKFEEPLDLRAAKTNPSTSSTLVKQSLPYTVTENFEKCRNSSTCFACMKDFKGEYIALKKHQQNAHPNIDFADYDVIVSTGLCRYISHVGLLASETSVIMLREPAKLFSCTNCNQVFDSVDAFHSHIVFECATDALQNLSNTKSPRGRPPKNSPWLTRQRLLGKSKRKLKFCSGTTQSQGEKSPTDQMNCRTSDAIKRKGTSRKPTEEMLIKKCDKSMSTFTSRKNELNISDNFIDIHKCEPCDKSFSYISYLEKHLKTCPYRKHSQPINSLKDKLEEQAKLQRTCPTCQRFFPFSATLRRHIRQGCKVEMSELNISHETDKTVQEMTESSSIFEQKKRVPVKKLVYEATEHASNICESGLANKELRADENQGTTTTVTTVLSTIPLEGVCSEYNKLDNNPDCGGVSDKSQDTTCMSLPTFTTVTDEESSKSGTVLTVADVDSFDNSESALEQHMSCRKEADDFCNEEKATEVEGEKQSKLSDCPSTSQVTKVMIRRKRKTGFADTSSITARRTSLRNKQGKWEAELIKDSGSNKETSTTKYLKPIRLTRQSSTLIISKETASLPLPPKNLKLATKTKKTFPLVSKSSRLYSLRQTRGNIHINLDKETKRVKTMSESATRKKKKGGWPKGKPRKVNVFSQQNSGKRLLNANNTNNSGKSK